MGDSARVQAQARAGGCGVHEGEHGADVSDGVTVRLGLRVEAEAGNIVQTFWGHCLSLHCHLLLCALKILFVYCVMLEYRMFVFIF